MNFKIDRNGWITINDVQKFCPFSKNYADGSMRRCGEWCIHFNLIITNTIDIYRLNCCHGTNFTFNKENFTDYRSPI